MRKGVCDKKLKSNHQAFSAGGAWTAWHENRSVSNKNVEHPWVEHLTTLTKSGWVLFSGFPHLTMKERPCHVYSDLMHSNENAEIWKVKYGNGIQKRKYGSALLTLDWGLVAQGWLYPSDVRTGSVDLGLQWGSLSRCTWLPVSMATSKRQVDQPMMRALCSGSSCDSDADATVSIISHREFSPMAQPVMHLSMVCPTWHTGADVGEGRGICRLNFLWGVGT